MQFSVVAETDKEARREKMPRKDGQFGLHLLVGRQKSKARCHQMGE
jgi:hypothetical protein